MDLNEWLPGKAEKHMRVVVCCRAFNITLLKPDLLQQHKSSFFFGVVSKILTFIFYSMPLSSFQPSHPHTRTPVDASVGIWGLVSAQK